MTSGRARRLRSQLPALVLILVAGGSCKSEPAGPSEAPRAATVALSATTLSFAAKQESQSVTATVRDQNGQVMNGASVTWSSSDDSVAEVQPNGTVVAIDNGSATVTARAGAASASVSVTVQQVPVSASVLGAAPTLTALGDTLRLSSEVLDSNGNEIVASEVAWDSSDPLVVTVDTAGLVTATGSGTADVTVTAGAVSGSVTVTVSQVASGLDLPDSLVLIVGETDTIAGALVDAGGSAVSGASLAWSSADEGIASVTEAGIVTAESAGTTTVTATVLEPLGLDFEGQVNVQVYDPLAVTTDPAPGVVGVPYADTLSATGGDGSYVWVLAGGALPSGLALDATGIISGTPTTSGTGNFDLEVTSGDGQVALLERLTLTVHEPLMITTSSLASGAVGVVYGETLLADGGAGGYTWSLVADTLPDGLALGPSGSITGTPTTEGTSTFTVEVTSSDAQADSAQLTIDVLGEFLVLTTSYLVGGSPGEIYSDAIAPALGGSGSTTYAVTDGALPAGLALAPNTGAIDGTPTDPGMAFFEITASDGGLNSSALYSLTISTQPSASAFNLWAVNIADAIPSATVRSAVDSALARWEATVVGDLGALTIPADTVSTFCNSGDDLSGLLADAFIDDVLVFVDIGPIDGPGSIVGQAGPCIIDPNTAPQTVVGRLTLDDADLGGFPESVVFTTVWHEIGHIMGIGLSFRDETDEDLFSWGALVDGLNTPSPTFAGTDANAEYVTLGGTPDIPVEADGGAGTAYSHWDEGVFDTEIMTGYLDFGSEQISRMTIASLADLGWTVSYADADSYSLPVCGPFCTARTVGQIEPLVGFELPPDWTIGVLPEGR